MDTSTPTLTLSKWGNSLSVRIPKKVLSQLSLNDNDQLSYTVKNGQLVLKPVRQESPLRKLFDGFDTEAYFADMPANKELDWGEPQGKEVW